MTLCLVINIGTENKKNCAAKHIFHYKCLNLKLVLAKIIINDSFVALASVIIVIKYDCTVIIIVNYNCKTFIVQATEEMLHRFSLSREH